MSSLKKVFYDNFYFSLNCTHLRIVLVLIGIGAI